MLSIHVEGICLLIMIMSCLGNVYVADTYNHRIRKVTVSTGVITTFAGTGSSSYSGDGGDATSATLYYPQKVSLDSSGRLRHCTILYIFSYLELFSLFRQRVHR